VCAARVPVRSSLPAGAPVAPTVHLPSQKRPDSLIIDAVDLLLLLSSILLAR